MSLIIFHLFTKDPEILDLPLVYRIGYLYFTLFSHRVNYYAAWTIGEIVCISSGLGFNGVDSSGRPKWDLLTNFSFKNVEV